jgi:ribosomal protein L44E
MYMGEGYEDEIRDSEFADPGGRSALRAGKRNKPCPTCGGKNKLTAKDVSLGYQCDTCADRAEGRYVGGDY